MTVSKSMTKSVFRLASVRARIIFGFGLILILALLIAVIGYVNLRALQSETEATFETANRVRELSLRVENEFLLARQSETAFMTGWRTIGIDAAVAEFVPANENHLAQARAALNELDALVQTSGDASLAPLLEKTTVLRPSLDTYENAFQQTVDFMVERGHAEGVEAALKNDLDQIEADVQPLDDTKLYQLVLQIGANEKSFFGTAEQQYADNIRLLAREFVTTIEASSATDLIAGAVQLDAETLTNQINTYVTTFRQLAVLEDGIKINTVIVREITPDIVAVAGQIGIEGETTLALARNRLADISQRSSTTLIVTAVITLGIGMAAALALGRQITLPLHRLSLAVEQIRQGDLEQRVPVAGGDELAALAVAFNGMTAELQTTLAGLEQRVVRRTHAIATSAEVSRRLSTILDETELVAAVVQEVQDAFDYYHAHIYLLNETGDALIMAGGTGETGEQLLASGHRIPVGKGLVGRAAETNMTVLVSDVSQEAGWLPNPLLPETKAETAVPIAIGGQILGVLDVQHNVIDGLHQSDADLLESIAGQVAVALQNARAYQQTQHSVEREALVNAIRQQIDQADTVESVLQVAVRELGRALGAEETRIHLQTEAQDGNGRV